MAIYFMTGKTFLKKYMKEDPKKIENTQYVLISQTIRTNAKYKKEILLAYDILYPDFATIADYSDYKSDKNYREAYFEKLHQVPQRTMLANIIKYGITSKSTVVLLCGERENKYRFLKMIQEYVEEEFGYHIYDYKKYKKGGYKCEMNDEQSRKESLKICEDYLKFVKKTIEKEALSSEEGRHKYVTGMKKKKLIKELVKRGLYAKGMSKKEMQEILETFI